MHSGQLHTSFKRLFRPVVQYKDIQTRFVFPLRCATFKPGNGTLKLSVLGQHSFVSFDQFRVDIEGYYIQSDYVYNKGSAAFSLH